MYVIPSHVSKLAFVQYISTGFGLNCYGMLKLSSLLKRRYTWVFHMCYKGEMDELPLGHIGLIFLALEYFNEVVENMTQSLNYVLCQKN